MFKVYQQTQNLKMKLLKKVSKYHEVKNQRGMTLLEIIIVLGIVGTIAAGVVVLAQRAFDSRAISDLVSNTNSIRIAAKEAYQRAPGYPAEAGTDSANYTFEAIKDAKESTAIVARLVQLGKVSTDEARNNISNNFIAISGAMTVTGQPATGLRGFVVELNGLNQEQCRAVISQSGNLWDYVEVGVAAAGASSLTATPKNLAVEITDDSPILRSLHADGNKNIKPDDIATVCVDSPTNAVILGSR